MNSGRYVFAQVADFIPRYEFDRIVRKYNGDYHVRELSCYNLFLHLMFVEGQLRPRLSHLGGVRTCADRHGQASLCERAGSRCLSSGMGVFRRRFHYRIM